MAEGLKPFSALDLMPGSPYAPASSGLTQLNTPSFDDINIDDYVVPVNLPQETAPQQQQVTGPTVKWSPSKGKIFANGLL